MPKLSFERQLSRLEEIVEKLEEEQTDLDTSVKLFEEGIALSNELAQKSETVKFKVSELKKISDGGKKPVLLVLGNEEHGISDTVRSNCDELVIIPWGGMKDGVKESLVDSLNVAQASSVLFYELMNK